MASILEQETSLLTLVALHFHDGRWCIESSRLLASRSISDSWSAGIFGRCTSPSSMVAHHQILGKRGCRAILENGMLVYPSRLGHDRINSKTEKSRLLESDGPLLGAPPHSWGQLCSWDWGCHASCWNSCWLFLADFQGFQGEKRLKSQSCSAAWSEGFAVDHLSTILINSHVSGTACSQLTKIGEVEDVLRCEGGTKTFGQDMWEACGFAYCWPRLGAVAACRSMSQLSQSATNVGM